MIKPNEEVKVINFIIVSISIALIVGLGIGFLVGSSNYNEIKEEIDAVTTEYETLETELNKTLALLFEKQIENAVLFAEKQLLLQQISELLTDLKK